MRHLPASAADKLAEEGDRNREEDAYSNDDEDLLPANSPLGLYAAEVGLGEAVTQSIIVQEAPVTTADVRPDASRTAAATPAAAWTASASCRLAQAVLSRLVAANAASLQRLLAEDDMREILLEATTTTAAADVHTIGSRRLSGHLAAAGLVAVVSVAAAVGLFKLTVIACLCALVLLGGFYWFLRSRLSALLSAAERFLTVQRACVRLTRERRQVELGFTMATEVESRRHRCTVARRWSALSRAAFESARRLTYSTRRLVRDARLGGLAASAADADFGEAFDAHLSPEQLAAATDDFAAPAIASMAGLLQLHLSDAVGRLLVSWARAPCHCGWARLRLLCRLAAELAAEAANLEARLERQRQLSVNVESLLADFLGSEKLVPDAMAASRSEVAASPPSALQTALHSLRLQAEALLAKAALAERSSLPDSAASLESLTAEARVHAANAVACCDEIAALMTLPCKSAKSAASSVVTSAGVGPCPVERGQPPPRMISPDSAPVVEDEFLEVVVPDFAGEDVVEADSAAAAFAQDAETAARRRAATRRMLGELDSVFAQRRRLFRERERLARERRGLPSTPPPPCEEDPACGLGSEVDSDSSGELQRRRSPATRSAKPRRVIAWHGTLEDDGDCDGTAAAAAAAPPLALLRPNTSVYSVSSFLATAALAARQERGIRLAEEAFGDAEDSDSGGGDAEGQA